jgi:hypothetical protein
LGCTTRAFGFSARDTSGRLEMAQEQVAQEPEVQLQPPGAGLPAVELFAARLGFRALNLFVSRKGASTWFRNEADRILALARSLKPEDATRRVLIPRLSGLEDSSRYWSVCMTLEHLVIVDSVVVRVIEALVAGVVPKGEASTAAVKPSPTTDIAAIDRFEATARDYLARVEGLSDLRTKHSYRHPWFGPLNGLGWHRMVALHHRIHRKQVERIIRLLPQPT